MRTGKHLRIRLLLLFAVTAVMLVPLGDVASGRAGVVLTVTTTETPSTRCR